MQKNTLNFEIKPNKEAKNYKAEFPCLIGGF